jgi:hypothetical protein
MVRIAERVWPAWREQAERWDEPSLLLVFSPTGDNGEAASAFRESLLEVQDAFEANAETSAHADPPFVGEWDWLRVSDGVLVKVVECDALEDVLPAVAAGLERRGVDGVFDLRERPVVATPPVSAHFLECRVRVRGERVRREPRSYRWHPEPEAHEALLAAAEKWCRRHGRGATESLTAGIVPPIPIEPGEDVLERIREEVVNRMYVSLSAVTADEFRASRRARGRAASRSSSGAPGWKAESGNDRLPS